MIRMFNIEYPVFYSVYSPKVKFFLINHPRQFDNLKAVLT